MKRGMNLIPAFPWAVAAPKHHQTQGTLPWSPAFACLPRAAQTISDEALMQRIVNYDRSAMHMLYARHHVRVYRFALRVLRDRALSEDVVSDVFFEVWRSADQFEGRSAVSTWLLGIARLKAFSALKRGPEEELDERAANTIEDPADDPAAPSSARRRVRCCGNASRDFRGSIARSSISSIFMKSRLQRSRRSSVSRATPSRLACSARASGWQRCCKQQASNKFRRDPCARGSSDRAAGAYHK